MFLNFRFYPSTTVEKFVDGSMGIGEIAEEVAGIGLYNKPEFLDELVALCS